MNKRKLGKKILFVTAAVSALAIWPAACSSGLSGPTGASPLGAEPSALVKSDALPKSFLPHPALAYAKSGSDSVSIADIAERAAPSVVNVSSTRHVRVEPQSMPFFDDPIFRRFFGPGGPRGGMGPEGGDQQQKGLGSGVVVSADGVILTNNHVVEKADEIRVTTADNKEYAAKVVGTDEKSDLAVLKIQGDASGLKPLPFGDSSRLRLGDVVLAIGNPFGVGQTITMGIVSAKGRANMGIVDYEDFIQTDAAINPGNSGGALVDMEGNLIGINTAILSRTGGNMGIGFAIPSDMAKPIMQSLIDHGKVIRGWLGVGIQDINRELAAAMKLPSTEGVLVSEVQDGSPAAKAGLQRGDVIVGMNGKKMASTGRFRNAVAAAGASADAKLEILRNGKKQTLDVKLGVLPEEQARAQAPGSTGGNGVLDGLSLDNLTPEARSRFEVPSSVKGGVVVSSVKPGSAAANAGLRPGDVVLEVNRRKVDDVRAFSEAYKQSKDSVLLLVSRQGRSVYMVVKR